MKISTEEVKQVAMLARLEFSAEEEERITRQLDNILQYMEKLNQVDTTNVAPFAPFEIDVINPIREDHVANQPDPDCLLANAPAREKNFFKVPKIIE